jgi:hypothetical protein
LNSNSEYFDSFTFIFVSFEESRLLISWCLGGRCSKVDSDKDRDRSRRSGANDRGWSHRSGDAVCSLHRVRGDEEHGFHG